MKTLFALALAAVTSAAFAQGSPPPGGPGGMAPPSGAQGPNRNRSERPQQAQAVLTETIRLLGLRGVQTELGITAIQYRDLVDVARALGGTVSEEVAFAAASKALTTAQATRLRELLVQDLGYNALSLASIRSTLSLTTEQTTQISGILATADAAKKAAATASDPRVAQQALSSLAAQSAAALAKILTPEQDAKLLALAGRALTSG